ncbi:MAG: cytochrome c oxidase subunit II [Chlorobiota bacterium]
MFDQASKYAGTVDNAMIYVTVISVIMLLLITVAMIYFVIKYNAKRNPIPTPYHGNVAIEVIWIVIPTILVMTMFFYGYRDFAELRNTKEQDMEVSVTAKMWDWDFMYENGTKTDTLYIPVNKTVKFNITSVDVLHSFYIPGFRIKEDAVPGRNGFVFITSEKTGTFDIACAEYCGQRHWDMYKKLVVMPQDEFAVWYDKNSTETDENLTENVMDSEGSDSNNE